MAATELLFGTALDFHLKRGFAARMLQYPGTLAQRPFLEITLRVLEARHGFNRVGFYALWPAGKIQTALFELEDHWAAVHYIRNQKKPAPQLHAQTIDWPRLLAKASKISLVNSGYITQSPRFEGKIGAGSRDDGFRAGVRASPAWTDLELLLRSLTTLHAQPLILSMPLAGSFYDHAGISRPARNDYYRKLGALVERYRFPLVEFEEHDEDPLFLIRHESHLTAKGWAHYDKALDDFYHGRLPRTL